MLDILGFNHTGSPTIAITVFLSTTFVLLGSSVLSMEYHVWLNAIHISEADLSFFRPKESDIKKNLISNDNMLNPNCSTCPTCYIGFIISIEYRIIKL